MGVGKQPERKKDARGQSAGMQMTCPKMSMVGKTTSVRGDQDEFSCRMPLGLGWKKLGAGDRILPSGGGSGPSRGKDVSRAEQGVPGRSFRDLCGRLLCAQGGLREQGRSSLRRAPGSRSHVAVS